MNEYDSDYYLRGKESGKSLYDNYRWMPEMTVPMVQAIVAHCGIIPQDRVLDFGCARGYTVKALRELGYKAYGSDISEWAIKNCDPEVADFVALGSNWPLRYDWVIAKDVLEHVKDVELTVADLMDRTSKGIFVVVPLSDIDGQPYVIPEYELDVTHCQRLCLASWAKMFIKPGWKVQAEYRILGVKDNWGYSANGNGFITARRTA